MKLVKKDWKIGEKHIWGKVIWIDMPIMARDVQIVVPSINSHQKLISAEKNFNNLVDRMTHSEAIRQILSSVNLVIPQ